MVFIHVQIMLSCLVEMPNQSESYKSYTFLLITSLIECLAVKHQRVDIFTILRHSSITTIPVLKLPQWPGELMSRRNILLGKMNFWILSDLERHGETFRNLT